MTMLVRWSALLACLLAAVGPGNTFFSSLLHGKSVTDEHPHDSRRSDAKQEKVDMRSRIRIRIYTGSPIEAASTTDFPLQDTETIFNSIDHSKPLLLYIHGFQEHPANESIRTVVGAHLERGNHDVMLLDWSDLAFENYITVAASVRDMARALAHTFDDLVHLGLDLETFRCVGHSLGAQICGFLGKYSSHVIPRITGLDPAMPGFYHPGAEHIDAKSARFVDIIHTDGGLYGALMPTGTVDFFANGGTRPQPGCSLIGIPLSPRDLCNHWRSWRYYAESVLNELAFPAVQCSSYGDFVAGKCARNRYIYAGYATPTDSRGSFHFATNDKSPFSKATANRAANLTQT